MKAILVLLVSMLFMMFGINANAVPIDLTPLTSVVDVTTVLAAIGVVSALKFGVPFAKWAYHQVASLFGGK